MMRKPLSNIATKVARVAVRDNFPAKTQRLLAERVAYRCSRQSCRRPTVAASSTDPARTVRVGVAAHIAAAAPGGPRYDSALTPEERSSAGNGIWLCQSCSRIVDSDPSRYSTDLLKQWKADAERTAELELTHGSIPDIANDIARLQLHTERVLSGSDTSRTILTPDAGRIHIDRTVVNDLVDALTSENVLLVSEAGAGKSALLLDVAERLHSASERVLFLDATDRRLVDARAYFGLAHPLEEVLERWTEGERPGYIVIDGLDAMRAGASFDAMLRLIGFVSASSSMWRVLAATRDYDLESAVQLRSLFPVSQTSGIPKHLIDGRFTDVAHVTVAGFRDADFQVLNDNSPILGQLWMCASDDLRRLLRNPFNLGIAAQIAAHSNISDLSHVSSRRQLLDLWWTHRISTRSDLASPVQRESYLRALCRLMLERRELRCPIGDCEPTPAAETLFSDGVTVSNGRYNEYVAFAHAILFDYAVYRLCLQTQSLTAFLEGHRELSLFALPSIRLRLVALWEDARALFYEEVREIFVRRQRRTLLMAAIRTIVENSSTVADMAPLLEHADDAGNLAVAYLVRIFIYLHQAGRLKGVGEDGGPWADLTLVLARTLPAFEHDGLLLLHECVREHTATIEQRQVMAHASRLYLRRQLRADTYEPVRARMAITCFMRTYDVSPRMSRPYLERLLAPRRLARFGKYDLQSIAYELKHVHHAESILAVYMAVFSDISVGQGQVDIGRRSAVMSMVQDAAQTLSTSRWALGEHFASFLSESPDYGVRALVFVLDQAAEQTRARAILTVVVNGAECDMVHDHSNLRDAKIYAHDPWYGMASQFEERLQRALAAGDTTLFLIAYDVLRGGRHAMFLWRILIRNASAVPETARLLAPIIAFPSVLLANELGEPIAQYLREAFAALPAPDRSAIEAGLLTLGEHDDEELRHYRRRRQTEFVRQIPAHLITTPALVDIAEAVGDQQASSRRERELALSGSSMSGTWVTAPRLSESAVSAGATDALAKAIDGARPLLFPPTRQTVDGGAELLSAIERIESSCVDSPRSAQCHAFDVMAGLIRTGFERNAFSDAERPRLVNLLMEGIHLSDPDDERADNADPEDETLSWGSPWRLADAAIAFGHLLHRGYDERIVEALRWLATFKRANVRHLAVLSAQGLVPDHADKALWFAERAVTDPVTGVVYVGLNLALSLYRTHPDASRRLAGQVFDRLRDRTDGADNTICGVLRALIYFVSHGDNPSRERLAGIISTPWANPHIAILLATVLTEHLSLQTSPELRATAHTLLAETVACASRNTMRLFSERGANVDSYPEEDRLQVEGALRLLQSTAERIYFTSGTMQQHSPGGGFTDSGGIDSRMFALLLPLLEMLAPIPYAGIAYNVVKTLLGAINQYPMDSLRLAALAVRSAGMGIATDHFAEDDVRTFVLRYIREHRGMLAVRHDALADIMDIVDIFVDAGWPQWIDVFVELDRIYRE